MESRGRSGHAALVRSRGIDGLIARGVRRLGLALDVGRERNGAEGAEGVPQKQR